MAVQKELIRAVDMALAGDWEGAHAIAQRAEDPASCWLHAVLHKQDGDTANSRYWYARTTHAFEEFADPKAELAAIRAQIAR